MTPSLVPAPPKTITYDWTYDSPYPTSQNTFYDSYKTTNALVMLDSDTVQPLATIPIEKNVAYTPDPGYHVFHLNSYVNLIKTEKRYNEVFTRPREDLADTFRVIPLATQAGFNTILIFEFTMITYSAAANDEIWLEFETYNGY